MNLHSICNAWQKTIILDVIENIRNKTQTCSVHDFAIDLFIMHAKCQAKLFLCCRCDTFSFNTKEKIAQSTRFSWRRDLTKRQNTASC